MAIIDLEVIEGLGLPYIAGAESSLADPILAPLFNETWQDFVAAFPGKTLIPVFDTLSVEELADIVDGIRLSGVEPPSPFVWFALVCDDAEVGAVLAALTALPMVVFAEVRQDPIVASSISYGTNPQTNITLQIQPSPNGIDSIYAWGIPGGAGDGIRIADIEGGWRLDHEDLIAADIHKLSVIGVHDVDHGTGVAGILVGSDNGVGTIGIAPNAGLELVTDRLGISVAGLAAAIDFAAARLTAGDVLLIEVAFPFNATPGPDVLVESARVVQNAIGRATGRGITVIEPAGNGGVNLDAVPAFAHARPGSPTFTDSGAIVVGAGELNFTNGTWARTFSSFGNRVDCFAAGSVIRSPSSAGTNTYQNFSGTSGASAIIAGATASLQAMTRAASTTRTPLLPADVRLLFSTARLGTLPVNPLARIGPMPDLRKITRARGLVRILPVGAAFIGGDALLMVQLDADNHMVRRHFTLFTGWGQPLPTPALGGGPSASDSFELNAAQPAVLSMDEVNPILRTVFHAFFSGPGGVHHQFWDTLNQASDLSTKPPIATGANAAAGRAVAVALPQIDRIAIAIVNPAGRLTLVTGDPQILASGVSAPLMLDGVGSYRRADGPAIVSRGGGTADLAAIEDGGSLNFFTGNVTATIGTGFFGPFNDPSVAFDAGARPALLAVGGVVVAAAVGTDGVLRAITFDPVAQTVDAPIVVDPGVTLATQGPVALARTAFGLVVLAVDTQGVLRAATRLVAGGPWTPLLPLLSTIAISPFGGVTAVSIDFGVIAIAVGVDGIVCSALSVDGLVWSPLTPLP